jgi:hypothetical protein
VKVVTDIRKDLQLELALPDIVAKHLVSAEKE